MKKEDFINECNKQMANITDPKRRAAKECRTGRDLYILRNNKAKVKAAKERQAKEKEARDNAKSKL